MGKANGLPFVVIKPIKTNHYYQSDAISRSGW